MRLEMEALDRGMDRSEGQPDLGKRFARTEEQGREFLELLRKLS